MITWIENNIYTQPTATMGRPIAASSDHTVLSFTGQTLAIVLVAALLISATMEVWF